MKIFLAIILLFFSAGNLKDISKINDLKRQAQEAYSKKDYAVAAESYKKLVDDYNVEDEHVVINLANAYYQLKDTANASLQYHKAASGSNKGVKSQALSQLGVMAHSQQKLDESLLLFKEALRANPKNEDARYNYELVKKLIDSQKEKDQNQKKDDEDEKIQPSDYAKKIKEQADLLVQDRKYGEAFDVMMKGLKQDQTVAYYKDFISRVNDILEIEK